MLPNDMLLNVRLMLSAFALALAGCASFKAERSSRFIDENGTTIGVEYAHGEETTTYFIAPNGARMPYKTKLKVRVTMPDGDSFTAYRHMSLAGVLYKTIDEEWEYLEEGMACAVARRASDGNGYLLKFQGMMCMNRSETTKKKPRITGSSTPQGFGHPSSGPRDSDGPRTVEQK